MKTFFNLILTFFKSVFFNSIKFLFIFTINLYCIYYIYSTKNIKIIILNMIIPKGLYYICSSLVIILLCISLYTVLHYTLKEYKQTFYIITFIIQIFTFILIINHKIILISQDTFSIFNSSLVIIDHFSLQEKIEYSYKNLIHIMREKNFHIEDQQALLQILNRYHLDVNIINNMSLKSSREFNEGLIVEYQKLSLKYEVALQTCWLEVIAESIQEQQHKDHFFRNIILMVAFYDLSHIINISAGLLFNFPQTVYPIINKIPLITVSAFNTFFNSFL